MADPFIPPLQLNPAPGELSNFHANLGLALVEKATVLVSRMVKHFTFP
jgi:hypothetical protein